jgi:hypothetical protein
VDHPAILADENVYSNLSGMVALPVTLASAMPISRHGGYARQCQARCGNPNPFHVFSCSGHRESATIGATQVPTSDFPIKAATEYVKARCRWNFLHAGLLFLVRCARFAFARQAYGILVDAFLQADLKAGGERHGRFAKPVAKLVGGAKGAE